MFALAVTQLDQAPLAGKHLDRELATVLPGHSTLDALDDGRDRAAVILELLGAILHGDPRQLADLFVVSALIWILEATPAADVVDQDRPEGGLAGLDVVEQLAETGAPADGQTAAALVRICLDDFDAALGGVVADRVGLVLGRVFLVLGRHADVLRGARHVVGAGSEPRRCSGLSGHSTLTRAMCPRARRLQIALCSAKSTIRA